MLHLRFFFFTFILSQVLGLWSLEFELYQPARSSDRYIAAAIRESVQTEQMTGSFHLGSRHLRQRNVDFDLRNLNISSSLLDECIILIPSYQAREFDSQFLGEVEERGRCAFRWHWCSIQTRLAWILALKIIKLSPRFFVNFLLLARVRSNDALDVTGLAVDDCGSEALLTLVRNCTNGRAFLSSAVNLQSWFSRNACILSNWKQTSLKIKLEFNRQTFILISRISSSFLLFSSLYLSTCWNYLNLNHFNLGTIDNDLDS